MCNKSNVTKRFFLVVHQPTPYLKPTILHVFPNQLPIAHLYKESNNQYFLTKEQAARMKLSSAVGTHSYIMPIDIPRDWFLH